MEYDGYTYRYEIHHQELSDRTLYAREETHDEYVYEVDDEAYISEISEERDGKELASDRVSVEQK